MIGRTLSYSIKLTSFASLSLGSLLGCRLTEMTDAPSIPLAPNAYYSQKSLCLDGTSGLTALDATTFFPQATLGFAETRLSISLWVKMNSDSPTGRIVDVDTTTNTFFNLRWDAGNSLIFHTKASAVDDLITTTIGTPTQWHHIVMAFDAFAATANERKMLYVDGQLVGQSTHPVELNFNPGNTFQFSRPPDSISGCLDDMYVWHRMVTRSEVTQLYNQGLPGKINGSLTDVSKSWTVEDTGLGAMLVDSTGNFDITFTGTPKVSENLQDPFAIEKSDPGSPGNPTGSGSSPFEGGNNGYGGELGDSGRKKDDGGMFP